MAKTFHNPGAVDSPSQYLVTLARVETRGDHDVVTIWNRGACCGTLTVNRGDGDRIAARLVNPAQLRIEPARETHLAASVHILRNEAFRDEEAVWVEVEKVGTVKTCVGPETYVDLKVTSIVWYEDGKGERNPDQRVRAWPGRKWGHGEPRIELLSGPSFYQPETAVTGGDEEDDGDGRHSY